VFYRNLSFSLSLSLSVSSCLSFEVRLNETSSDCSTFEFGESEASFHSFISMYQSLSRSPSRCFSISPDSSAHIALLIRILDRIQPAPGKISCRLLIAVSVSFHLTCSELLCPLVFYRILQIFFLFISSLRRSHFVATRLSLSISITSFRVVIRHKIL